MSRITLKRVEELAAQVDGVLGRVFAEIRGILPEAELHHIGATALPGALTKGDVDVLVRLSAAKFPSAVAALGRHFPVKQPVNWTGEFASFGDDERYGLPVGIQVVVRDSSEDFLLYLRDYFIANPSALIEYNRLKVAHSGEGREGYWRAKNEFLGRILALRRG